MINICGLTDGMGEQSTQGVTRLLREARAGDRAALDEVVSFPNRQDVDLILLDAALNRLAELDPLQARIVEMRFFAGLTIEEVAEVLGVSDSEVKREWRSAKAWLTAQMK